MTEADQKILNRVADKLKKSEPIHQTLPGKGLLKIERPVPFLIVYRIPKEGEDHFTNSLGRTESSYIIGEDNKLLCEIVNLVVQTLTHQYSSFLLIEIWMTHKNDAPPFTIYTHQKSAIQVSKKLSTELNNILNYNWSKTAVVSRGDEISAPEGFQSLVPVDEMDKHNVTFIGLEVAPVFINTDTGQPYPLMLRELRSGYSTALRKSFLSL